MFNKTKVTNKTMELADCKAEWTFNETYKCWCLEDILYTAKAVTPKFQRLSIFVPEPYMRKGGEINEAGQMNGYTAQTVPVIFENNSAGYMQMPHTYLGDSRCYAGQYLEQGYVYITCGNRGHESKDADGRYCGKAPANLVDLKTALRFIRHNQSLIPGNMNRIISIGWSAGGAMSTLLAVTGNNKNFTSYLEENGAFMEESDAVYASQIYCPVTDLEHADLAYEWLFAADKENEAGAVAPAGIMTPFEEALSIKLKDAYINYFNNLKLVNPDNKEILQLTGEGRTGSGYEYLMSKLNESASIYLKKLENKELSAEYSVADYILANEKSEWLSWDGKKAIIKSLDSYILSHRRRLKPCTSFDTLKKESCENRVFGTPENPNMHFNPQIADAISELREQFPKEYAEYYTEYAKVKDDAKLAKRVYLINPLNYIGTDEKSDQAKYCRIRVGASDADTSFTVSMTLALKLQEAGIQTDYQIVWEQPHSEADYKGEVIDWIKSIV